MGSASRRWALNLMIHTHGHELRSGDTELLVDAVITDLDVTEARLGVASFSLDELAERFPTLGLAW